MAPVDSLEGNCSKWVAFARATWWHPKLCWKSLALSRQDVSFEGLKWQKKPDCFGVIEQIKVSQSFWSTQAYWQHISDRWWFYVLFHVSPPIQVDTIFKQMLQTPTKTMCQIATNLRHFGLPWLTPIEEQLVSHMVTLLLEMLSKLTKASVTKLEEKALNYNEYQASWGFGGVRLG